MTGKPVWLKYGGAELGTVLQHCAYVAEGTGMPLYVLASPAERETQILWFDRRGYLKDFQFRWLPGCQKNDDPNQVVELLVRRDAIALRFYMAQLLPADHVSDDAGRINIFNAHLAVVRFILKVFSANGADRPGGAPRFIWTYATDTYGLDGYSGPEALDEIRAKFGAKSGPTGRP